MKYLMLFIFVFGFLLFPEVSFSDAANDNQDGIEVLEKGTYGLVDTVVYILTSISLMGGLIFLLLGLMNSFSSNSRNDPEIVRKGIKRFILGALLSTGSAVYLSGLFTTQLINENTNTAQDKWDEGWGRD